MLATDYYADALEFTAANAAQNSAPTIDTRLVDWRRLPDDLGTFDVVAASDVLYEEPQAALVAGVFARTLRLGGVGWVSDPGRRTAAALANQCARLGLKANCVDRIATEDAGARLTVSVFEIRHCQTG